MSSPFEVAASGGFGVTAGILSGFLGMGGGAVLPPLLVFVLRMDQHRAQSISLAALLPPVGLPAVLAYRRSGVRIDTRLVLLLIGGFVVGVVAGALLANRVPSRDLRRLFAAFLTMLACRAVFSGRLETPEPAPRGAGARWAGLPIGLVAGAMSGLLGVGGGVVALPLLRRFGGLGRLEAQAVTLAMMLPPIGLPAVYLYAKQQGGLPWDLLCAVGVGFALGAGMGARLAGNASPGLVRTLYAGLLAAMAVVLVSQA